ncbi:phosphatase 2C 76-like [Thraustotheca clavata]|uniref:Phosphatase 2C 76-like n=1 Tax=Thraustotheca clavata TaxID=74557 RepID=A0A1V9Z9I8_9STRA|nr:phosphatase 2C 76-like [Thraustotheca clavata]
MINLPCGVATDKGPKRSQEDAYFIGGYTGRLTLNGFSGSGQPQELGCYGVFDGHGGERASRFCAEYVFDKILVRMEEIDTTNKFTLQRSMEESIKEGILELDKKFIEVSDHCKRLSLGRGGIKRHTATGIEDGTTCLVAIIRDNIIYVGNVGDSRAIICKVFANGKVAASPLTMDHKPEAPEERRRIEERGGEVTGLVSGGRAPDFALNMWPFNRLLDVPRVNGILSMSRAIGDASLKHIVTADADVTTHITTSADKYLIMACDGLWDVVSNNKAAKIAAKCSDAQTAASQLCQYAINHGTQDNVTVIVVDLRGISSTPESPDASVASFNSHTEPSRPVLFKGPPRTQSLPKMK